MTISIGATSPLAAADTDVTALINGTDFHGFSVDANDPSRIYLATHHGLFVVAPNGEADRVSDMQADFMGFTPAPNRSKHILFERPSCERWKPRRYQIC